MLYKNKKVLLISAIVFGLAVLVILIYLGIGYYKSLTSPKSPVLSAIPSSAGLIVEIGSPEALWEKLSDTSSFWKEMSQIEPFGTLNKKLIYSDSILEVNEDLKSLFESGPLFISFHPAINKICQFLFLKECPNREDLSYIKSIFEGLYEKNASFTKSKFKNVNVLEIKIGGNSESIFIAIDKGVLMLSEVRTLVEDAILQLNSGVSFTTEKGFTEVAQTVGKKVDANIFINYKQFQLILNQLISDTYKKDITFLSNYGQWLGLDLNVKNDAIIINGFTNPRSDGEGFLSLMTGQAAQKIEVTKLLPHNVSSFIFLGFDNFKLYFNNYLNQAEKQHKLNVIKADFTSFKNNYNVDIENDISNNISSEVVFANMNEYSVADSSQNYLFIRFKDREKLIDFSRLLTVQSKANLGKLPDTTSYRDYSFGYFDYPEIFNSILGTSYDIADLNFQTIIDNYLVLGKSRESLMKIINAVVFNKNLNNSATYSNFSDLLSAKANIYIYFNEAQSFDMLKAYLSKPIADSIGNYKEHILRFESFAIQVSESNGLFYNNICLTFNQRQTADKAYSLWETELENAASGKIYKVKNHNDNSVELLTKDEDNNLYLIDCNGVILWSQSIGEEILSDIVQIDYFNNGKLQYMFNSANNMYLIDRNGKNVANFPMKLKPRATNGFSIFDYDNNKNYRIFIANEKNEIVNFDKNVEKISGWNVFKTLDAVKAPVQFIRLLGKDFLIVSDVSGKSYILDRKGEIRLKFNKPFEKSANNIYYSLITSDKIGQLITTNKSGKVVSVDFNGKIEETLISEFSDKHFFMFEDINNNTLKEYIFVDNKKLFVYDLNKVLLSEYEFDSSVLMPPVYFNDNNKYKLGVVTTAGKIYLFNNEMALVNNFPLEGNVSFILEHYENVKSYVIAANQKIVYKYLLE